MKLPEGFLFSGINCGIKKRKLDLGLIVCQDFYKTFGAFTVNVNSSYSVLYSKKNINNPIKAVLVNSGNANCYSHRQGLKDTEEIASCLAKTLGVKRENILIVSTGIIGKKLPKDRIIKSFPALIKNLSKDSGDFSKSILTTDTFEKVSCAKIPAGGKFSTLTGFAKGAGMVYPNLATMLGFVITDAGASDGFFKKTFHRAVEESFNSISVDGCMSTNDTVLFISSGKVPLNNKEKAEVFSRKLKGVCLRLAKMIIKDAEGATKFVEIVIRGAKTGLEAKKAGLCLANSNLFKCALYGANSNWGRIISALGQAGIKVGENIGIKSNSLREKNLKIIIDLKRGKAGWSVYTSDLTPEYVRINAEYN